MGTQNATANGELKDPLVVCQTSQGTDIHAKMLRVSRYSAVIEIYTPGLVVRSSEAFDSFRIVQLGRAVYSGRGVVQNVVDAGLTIICEVKLDEGSWIALDLTLSGELSLPEQFKGFFLEWQKVYKVSPEFKLVVGDLHSFLSELRLWLEQIELVIRSQPSGSREQCEREVLDSLYAPVTNTLGILFERFEYVTSSIDSALHSVHSRYAQRQLHPLVLCAPFMYRTFWKPLGYAGDYEMVNMMMRDCYEGGSLFAKILNAFFLSAPPVAAHRNRCKYLGDLLKREIDRVTRCGRNVKILNLGCGPALEVQMLLDQFPLSSRAEFLLLDFNEETIEHTRKKLTQSKQKNDRATSIQLVKKSVAQLVKEHSKPSSIRYDIVYCAGLFDYLSDPVCEKLLELFYEMLSPGGVVVATNVDCSNPSRGWMEHMVDWHLCYRSSEDLRALTPKGVPPESITIIAEPTGVNVFVEIRK